MKQTLIILFAIISLSNAYSQCGKLDRTFDKETEIESYDVIISSKDYYSLMSRKNFDPSKENDSLNYFLFLHATSQVMLNDSILNSSGVFELTLASGKKIIIPNVKCMNKPLGFTSVGFTVVCSEKVIEELASDPIQKIKVFGILETEFSMKKQATIMETSKCLLNQQKK